MSTFTVEFQNAQTGWQWVQGLYTPDGINPYSGVVFNDTSIIADYLLRKPFFTWTNFRVQCGLAMERMNLWASEHDDPKNFDPAGVTFQSGTAEETYGKRSDGFYRDSDRLYFWIKATNADSGLWMSQDIFDPDMALRSVHAEVIDTPMNLSKDRIVHNTWMGWDPQTNPLGGGSLGWRVNESSAKADIARWIMGWDNQCMNVYAGFNNPLVPNTTVKSCADIFRSIWGVGLAYGTGAVTDYAWLGCQAGKYIYGKLLYCLEDYDFENHVLLVTDGTKAFGVDGMGLYYG